MGLIKAKCTECGAPLQVNEGSKKAKCPHCGNVFIVQDAINNYNYTYNTTNNINTDVVNIVNQKEDFIVKSGVLTKYVGADDKIVIPENIKKIGVGENNFGAFEGTAIESIVIPENVKEITGGAFACCKYIKHFEALSPIKIEKHAFDEAVIENMTINISEESYEFPLEGATIENLTLLGDPIYFKDKDTYEYSTRINNITIDSKNIKFLVITNEKSEIFLPPNLDSVEHLVVYGKCDIPNVTNYATALNKVEKNWSFIKQPMSKEQPISEITILEKTNHLFSTNTKVRVHSYAKTQTKCPICGSKYGLIGFFTHKCKHCKSKVIYHKD